MSTVIKAGESGTVLRRLSTVDLADHLAEAKAILDDARLKAAQIVSRARHDAQAAAEKARRAGQEAGFKAGHDEGLAVGRKEAFEEASRRFDQQHADLVSNLRRVLGEIDSVKDDLRVAAEHHLLEFAVRLAKKLTFAIGVSFRESAVENARRAIELTGAKTDLVIRIHPSDRASMETFADSSLRRLEESPAVTLVADESLAPGGCVVEHGATQVDSRLETQTDELVTLLLGSEATRG